VEKKQNKSYYNVESHSRSSRSVPIESWYTTSYYISEFDILSHTVSELSQLAVQILDTVFLSPPLGGLGTMYGVNLGLIGKHVVDYLLVLIELFPLQ